MLSDDILYAIGEVFFERMHMIVEKYMRKIGEHVRDIGQLLPSDAHRAAQMRRAAVTQGQMTREIARVARQSVTDVYAVLEASARSDMHAYEAWAQPIQSATAQVDRMIAAQYQTTAGRMLNLSNTTVVSDAYVHAIDIAVQTVQSGAADYKTATRDAIREAAQSGLRVRDGTDTTIVDYASGHTRRLDSAARQNVLDGVRDLSNAQAEYMGNVFGADGVEISAHYECALDHLPWQGRQMSQYDFDILQASLPRPYRKWNCRHHIYPIKLGISPPAHTQEELSKMREWSTEKVTIDGRTKTRYEWTQEQRRIETKVRELKDTAVAAKAAGDMDLRRECQRGINTLTDYYKRVSEAAGIKTKAERMSVSGFNAVKAAEPKKLTGLPDEAMRHTVEVSIPEGIALPDGLHGVVPKGATMTRVEVMAGAGTSTAIRDVNRLQASYPESPTDGWQKKSGTVYGNSFHYVIHWYQNGEFVAADEVKLKGVKAN